MPVDRCEQCNASLGRLAQDRLPGTTVALLCIACETNQRARWMLAALPDEGEAGWSLFNEWEQNFVSSVRRQFERKGSLTENQYGRLEEIYEKT